MTETLPGPSRRPRLGLLSILPRALCRVPICAATPISILPRPRFLSPISHPILLQVPPSLHHLPLSLSRFNFPLLCAHWEGSLFLPTQDPPSFLSPSLPQAPFWVSQLP